MVAGDASEAWPRWGWPQHDLKDELSRNSPVEKKKANRMFFDKKKKPLRAAWLRRMNGQPPPAVQQVTCTAMRHGSNKGTEERAGLASIRAKKTKHSANDDPRLQT